MSSPTLGDKITGTEGLTPDYIVIAEANEHFVLAVKPIVSYIPQAQAFGFGLRFRAFARPPLVISDSHAHSTIWNEIPFVVFKPTHASASVCTHTLPASEISGQGNSLSLLALLAGKGLFPELAEFALGHLGEPEGLKHLEKEPIAAALEQIMGEKLAAVEAGVNVKPDPDNLYVDFFAKPDDGETIH
jgi:hypothetical protein